MKKIISIAMALITVVMFGTVVTGCHVNNQEQIDKTKTQLYVSNIDKGVGREYIEAIGDQFEKDFAQKSFEPGKVGVQVLYNHNTVINSASFYESSFDGDKDNVYFTEYINYKQWANKFMDVTDIIESPAITGYNAETGQYTTETKPIKDKIDPVMLEFLNMSGENVAYKGFPFYLAIKSVNYNADLWNEKSFYLCAAPSDYVALAIKNNTDIDQAIARYNEEIAKIKRGEDSESWFFGNADGETVIGNEKIRIGLSAGPDGKFGTFDDGFPATYDEFYALCEYIVKNNVTPFIWTGANPGYADMITQSLFTNDLGKERAEVYYSLNGTMDNLVKFVGGKAQFDGNGDPVIDEPYTFNGGVFDGYEIMRTASKYYALKFAEKIATTPSWTHTACYDTTTQSEAQNKFLTEGYTKMGNPTAMLMDGAWWQAEADATFRAMEKVDVKYAKENRKFGVMPLPYSTIETFALKTQNNEKNVIVTENDSVCFINNNIDRSSPQYEVARVFMSYFNSDASAGLFTAKTNMLRAIDVDLMANEYYEQMSPYGKSFAEYRAGVDVMFPYTTNKLMNDNRNVFQNSRDGWQFWAYSIQMGQTWKVINTIHTYFANKGIDAEHYFNAIYSYYKTIAWPQLKLPA
ncbi:MAG: hypothetical protein J5697_02410 [Clostridia bacterium]|nr:hypothetical protein [Clostridia bacterium]